jgi:hypothetical protein
VGQVINIDSNTTLNRVLNRVGLERATQTGIVEVPLPRTLPDELTAASEIDLPFSIGFLSIFIGAVSLYLWTARKEQPQKKQTALPSHSRALPCLSCSFYTHNPYLKCAVRPTTAMTKEATGCSDYEMNK